MDSKQIILAIVAAAVAIALNWIVVKLLGLQRKRAAQAEGQVILEQAKQEAKTKLREAELEVNVSGREAELGTGSNGMPDNQWGGG